MKDEVILAEVEPAVLTWARVSAELTPVAASRKLGLADDIVESWESGQVAPTIAQLKAATKVYRRALCVFFLSEPPDDFDTLRDLRRHVGDAAATWSVELHAEFRRALTQRDNYIEVSELEGRPLPNTWRLTGLPGDDEQIAAAARRHLIGQMPGTLPGPRETKYDHFNAWVAAIERSGVLVLHTEHGSVSISEMRGFSLHFDELPCITVNGSDSVRGRLFTLLHEFVHLLLRTEGICDTTSDARPATPDRQLEARCNAISASILMPADEVRALPAVVALLNQHDGWDYQTLASAAAHFGVSAEAFLRRLVTLGRVPMAFYLARRDEFAAAYEADDQRTRSGGNFYNTTARDRGKGYIRLIAGAHRRGVIGSSEAASYLGVKVSQIGRLADVAALPQ